MVTSNHRDIGAYDGGSGFRHSANPPRERSERSIRQKFYDIFHDNGHVYANDPTPEEQSELDKRWVDRRAILTGKAMSPRQYIVVITLLILVIVIVVLIEVYHKTVVRALQPPAARIRDLKAGWLIPIAIMFVLSFPPLFGNEIVQILVGLVWGIGIGFLIVIAGTLLGEMANFLVFRYACRPRAEKIERKNLTYACLARIIKDGSFFLNLIVRLSAVPTHISTVIFATSGMSILSFLIGAILALPKQLAFVWLGVVIFQQGETKRQRIINYITFFALAVITLASLRWIIHRMNKVKLTVMREMRSDAVDLEIRRNNAPSAPAFTSGAPVSSWFSISRT